MIVWMFLMRNSQLLNYLPSNFWCS